MSTGPGSPTHQPGVQHRSQQPDLPKWMMAATDQPLPGSGGSTAGSLEGVPQPGSPPGAYHASSSGSGHGFHVQPLPQWGRGANMAGSPSRRLQVMSSGPGSPTHQPGAYHHSQQLDLPQWLMAATDQSEWQICDAPFSPLHLEPQESSPVRRAQAASQQPFWKIWNHKPMWFVRSPFATALPWTRLPQVPASAWGPSGVHAREDAPMGGRPAVSQRSLHPTTTSTRC